MKIPNLLHIDKSNPISKQYFRDMEIENLLPASVIYFLRFPCCKEEILSRQKIFRAMEDVAFNEAVDKCRHSIDDFCKQKMILNNSGNEIERCFLQIQILESFIDICQDFKHLHGYCEAANVVADFFLSEEFRFIEEETIQHINEMKSIMLKTFRCNLLFEGDNYLLKDMHSTSFFDVIEKCAKGMGFNTLAARSVSIPLDEVLTNAFIQLYSEEITLLNKIEADCLEKLDIDFSTVKLELDFLINVSALMKNAISHGLPCTYPSVSVDKVIYVKNAYSYSLLMKTKKITPNDVRFDETNSFWFLIGANGGGKTEYLRTVGTNLLFFLSGCPIFAETASIFPFTFLASHFPKEERFERMGRLEEEMERAIRILNSADSNSVLLFNEIFAGTDEKQGTDLILNIAKHMLENKNFGLVVTHFSKVNTGKYAILAPEVINADGGNKRTYRIIEKAFQTSSYARDIIFKYGLDRKSLSEKRIKM